MRLVPKNLTAIDVSGLGLIWGALFEARLKSDLREKSTGLVGYAYGPTYMARGLRILCD